MNRFTKKGTQLVVLILSAYLGGCLTTRTQLREQTRLQSDVAVLQENKAEFEARNQELDSQLRNLNGRIEILELGFRDLKESLRSREMQMNSQQEGVDGKFFLVQEALSKMESELNRFNEELSTLKKNQAQKVPVKSGSSSLGDYNQAELDFAKKKWKEAAIGYQKYRDRNPKGKNYADATYKIGVCFQEMGMKSEAKAFFEEAVEKFPKTRTAEKAKYRLKSLK